jgi:hypothetical protein
MSLAGLAGAMFAPMASAVPFTVELTMPNATGFQYLAGRDKPFTQFTAPTIVIRVSGDTANVIHPGIGGGSRYQASTSRIEIPGVGNGTALGSDVAVLVGSEGVDVTSPAHSTIFAMGARAYMTLPPGYDLQASLGPLEAHVSTYAWGPTSGLIAFTLDSGIQGYVSAGFTGSGILRIVVGGNAPNPVAARIYTDLAKFQKATGPNRVATFEEGSGAASGGVTFGEGELQVVERLTETSSLDSRPHGYWFGTMGTPSHFALNSIGSPLVPANGFEATFPEAVLGAGFLFNCYECKGFQHNIVWTTREADGTAIEHGTIIVDEGTVAGSHQPAFVGLTTTRSFRRLTIARAAPFSGGVQPWVIDDLRFATTLPAIEYRHAGFDHYFVTSIAEELSKLDDGTFGGWTRTGLQFNVGPPGAAGTRPVCRLFSTAFGPRSSHFYSSDPAECELRKADPHWQFEGIVFSLGVTDASGTCGGAAAPLFRLYNNGQGGAPNHRYTTSVATRQSMIDAGWISEGSGALGEIGCVLQ